MRRTGIALLCILLSVLPSVQTMGSTSLGTVVCGKDLDDNGSIDGMGELQKCAATPQGPLCPIDRADCTASYEEALCPPGGSLNTGSDKCETVSGGGNCPPGYMFHAGSGGCEASPLCPASTTTYTCPTSGQSFSSQIDCDSTCIQSVACNTVITGPTGNSFRGKVVNVGASGNSITFQSIDPSCHTNCEVQNNTFTFTGLTFSGNGLSQNGDLYKATANGTMMTLSFNVCVPGHCSQESSVITIHGGYATGSFTGASAMGVGADGDSLMFGYSHDCNGDTCRQDQAMVRFVALTAMCPLGQQNQCSGSPRYCSAPMACTPVTTRSGYDSVQHKCFSGNTVCPLGANYACMDAGGGTMQCSPFPCTDYSAPGNARMTKTDDTMLQDDGERDESGNCLGEIYLFTGRGVRCRGAGKNTGFTNCCNQGQQVLRDSVGSVQSVGQSVSALRSVYQVGQVAYYSGQIANGMSVEYVGSAMAEAGVSTEVSGSVLTGALSAEAAGGDVIMASLMDYAATTLLNPTSLAIAAAVLLAQELLAGGCDQQDIETDMMRDSGRCHYVGEYCEDEYPLIGCVQHAKAYCCFNSKLARIIHEQGRPQLREFPGGAWGFAEAPHCRGFTATEFQMLDFSKMDLSEYFGDLQAAAQGRVSEGVERKIQQFYDNVQNKGK